jgi:transposase InsO family protein
MQKDEIRKEFFKLKLRGFSYSQCKKILKGRFNYTVSKRTLQRWVKRLDSEKWDLLDESRKPKVIHTKITKETEERVILLRNKTGFGCKKLVLYLPELGISARSIHTILRKHKLVIKSNKRGKPKKYIRWQRKHPNSLWQIDHSDQKVKGKWLLSVIDDCSRYSIALVPLERVTTKVVTYILDELIKIYGKPRELLTDNGSAYGLKSIHSKFDRWCRKRGIKHIRSAVHSPTTCGKVERLFQTFKQEIEFCGGDIGRFRMRYNHFRPHISLDNKSPADVYFVQ